MNPVTLYLRRGFAVVALWLVAVTAMLGQDFMSTRTVTHKASAGGSSFEASVEFPTEASAPVLKNVRRWITDMLETEDTFKGDIRQQLQVSGEAFLAHATKTSRNIMIERDYEDGYCVTFTATIKDKGTETWVTEDCATFSKRDGHRLTLEEIFSCSEEDIQKLVWQYRGSKELDAESPSDIFPMNAGFIDGWVVVTAPAHNSPASAFRLRYEEITSYLNTTTRGYYRP